MGPPTCVTGRWKNPLGEDKIIGCVFLVFCSLNVIRVCNRHTGYDCFTIKSFQSHSEQNFCIQL